MFRNSVCWKPGLGWLIKVRSCVCRDVVNWGKAYSLLALLISAGFLEEGGFGYSVVLPPPQVYILNIFKPSVKLRD